jgi:hypothetical protein
MTYAFLIVSTGAILLAGAIAVTVVWYFLLICFQGTVRDPVEEFYRRQRQRH